MDLQPGRRIDRYELVVPIAKGGMGEVWLARTQRMPGFEKFFAIKTVLPELATDAAFRQMFLDEARIACAINHSNVATIVDVGEEAGTLFMVMEWVDGHSLHAMALALEPTGEPIPPGILLRIAADACGGLHAVHEARDRSGKALEIVHRDISPHNVLVDPQGQAKLIDFGVAKARNRMSETTNSGTLKGKVRYMAPEQAAAVPLDRRADIWALGAVLYRLIEGRAPLEGETDLAVVKRLLASAEPEPMRSDMPVPVVAAILKCLCPDRDERFATALELRGALEIAMRDANMTTTTADVAAFVAGRFREQTIVRHAKVTATLAVLDQKPSTVPPPPPSPLALEEDYWKGAAREEGPRQPIPRGAARPPLSLGPKAPTLANPATLPNPPRLGMPDREATVAVLAGAVATAVHDANVRPRPSPARCARHGLAMTPEGTCVRCRREQGEVASSAPEAGSPPRRGNVALSLGLGFVVAAGLAFYLRPHAPAAASFAPPPVAFSRPPAAGAAASSMPLAALEPAVVAAEPSRAAAAQGSATPLDRAMHQAKIELFSRAGSDDCMKARAWLVARGYTYAERNIDVDPAGARAVAQISPDKTVPAFDVDGQRFAGFDSERLQAALEYAGARRLQR
jgi:serine/threonine-protein kinase